MPREIDCPDCGGMKCFYLDGMCKPVKCLNCKEGKITVYTEAEMQEKLGYVEGLYTPEELNKAVQEEREAIIELGTELIRKNFITITPSQVEILTTFAEAIRARSK